MKKQILVTTLMFAFSIPALADTTYTVRAGDTILKLADRALGNENDRTNPRRYEVAKQILAKNPQLKNKNQLTPGDQLTLPDFEKATPATAARAEVAPPPPAPAEKTQAAPVVSKAPSLPAPHADPTLDALIPPKEHAEPPAAKEHANSAELELKEAEENVDFFTFQPRTAFNNYKVKNIEAEKEIELNTRINVGLGFSYGKALGKKAHLIVEAGANYVQLQQFSTDENTLNNNLLWLKNVGVGFDYELTSSLSVDFMARASEQLFILPDGTNTYTLDSVLIPGAELSLDWDFVHNQDYSVGVSVGAEYAGSASKNGRTYKSVVDPVASLYWTSHMAEQKMQYRGAFTYGASGQAPDVTEQEAKNYGLNVSFILPLR